VFLLQNCRDWQRPCDQRAGALIAKVVGFAGGLAFDPSNPEGTPRKLLDVSRLSALGWSSSNSLRDGLATIYRSFHQSDGS
jgi:GDP-L-fucose synthase